ncbi:hypothetical protein Tco_0926213 [Tanacetum coccineum]|uniref:Uncharacterized protein n=1 Tax=Tanacetum coccineum TaxID=301880 RepID=A0ABQ5DA45_9ASTR
MVIAPELSVIDMAELVRLQVCVDINDTWDWVAIGSKRQSDAVVGAFEVTEDAPAINEGGRAILAPMQGPQQLPPQPPAAARTMPQRLGRVEEEMQGMCRDVMSLHGLVEKLITDQGSSPAAFERRTRHRTDGASTSTSQQDQQQPDP